MKHLSTFQAVVPLWACVLLMACGSPEAPPEAPPAPAVAVAPTPEVSIPAAVQDREALRDTALKLAGLATEAGGDWAQHAELIDEIWSQVEGRHLEPMRAWSQTELALNQPEAPLYYPFGGPDLPSVQQFFPAASSYVLVGLELPGRIPNLGGLTGPQLDNELERLRGGLANLAEAGYFVTKRMETDWVAPQLEGVLPVLYIFLARGGFTPTSVEFIQLDDMGAVVPMESATNRTATAVRLRFEALDRAEDAEPETRELFYFSQDLSNEGLQETPAFNAFLRSLGAFNTFMKSASYLLHMDGFTQHLDFLTAHAGTVLQDDSGIPVRKLPPAAWQLRYFGTYSRTLPTYREWFQEDLATIYQEGTFPSLPFAIGYHSKIGGSCLIWAERRGG